MSRLYSVRMHVCNGDIHMGTELPSACLKFKWNIIGFITIDYFLLQLFASTFG